MISLLSDVKMMSVNENYDKIMKNFVLFVYCYSLQAPQTFVFTQ